MAELTEEQLRQMSPEQIRELQKESCLFCRIVEGKVPAKKIYEDDECLAILDINPANPGHVLLMPKEHHQIMPQMPIDTVGKLFMVAKALVQATLKSLKTQGTTVFAANGVAAGQRAPHFMLHIIPRVEGDGVGMTIPETQASEAELENLKKRLEERMKKEFGVKAPVTVDKEPEIIEAEFKEIKKPEAKKKKKAAEKAGKEQADKKKKVDLDALTNLLARR